MSLPDPGLGAFAVSRGGRPKPSPKRLARRPATATPRRRELIENEAEGRPDKGSAAPLSLEALVGASQIIAAEVAAELDQPDDEFPAFLLLDTARGTAFSFLPPFSDEERDELLYQALPEVIASEEARGVALVMPVWTAPAGDCAPSEHPEREEMVIAWIISPEGSEATLSARVERSDARPPEIGTLELREGGPARGPLAEVLRQAVAGPKTPDWARTPINDSLL
jgi:hypothetical protein